MFPSNLHRTIDLTTFMEMESKQPALLHGSINIGFERFMETSGQQQYMVSRTCTVKNTTVFHRNFPK